MTALAVEEAPSWQVACMPQNFWKSASCLLIATTTRLRSRGFTALPTFSMAILMGSLPPPGQTEADHRAGVALTNSEATPSHILRMSCLRGTDQRDHVREAIGLSVKWSIHSCTSATGSSPCRPRASFNP